MNDLEKYFTNNTGRIIFKWKHYFDVYDRHFSPFRNKEVIIVEIGVANGGSLQLWKNYFGDKAKIYGVDINPVCKDFEEENIQIFIGSQSDRKFLRKLKEKIPPIDILIDDGGHKMDQQRITFEELYGHIKENGIYFCEDMLTSYQIKYGGGVRRKGTFVEYTKRFIDKINAWHSDQTYFKVDDFTRTARSVHFYDSIVVVEKAKVEKPYTLITGERLKDSIPVYAEKNKFRKMLIHPVLHGINSVLRFFHLPGFIWK